jgi:hypothetical protein|tara:strand:+ start:62 stop:412 length:351 start_codon:yes stop_codon:yes gene_type:complete
MNSHPICKCPKHGKTNKKGKTEYTFDLPLDEALVRSYVGKTQLTTMGYKYKDTKLDLFPPGHGPAPSDGKIWIIRATCRHRESIRGMSNDMIDRYNQVIEVVRNLRNHIDSQPLKN